MSFNRWFNLMLFGLVITDGVAFANNSNNHEQVQVPQCLAAKITSKHTVLAENKAFKIIDLPAADLNQLALLADKVHCGRFVNLSHKIKGDTLIKQTQSAQNLLALQGTRLRSDADAYEIKHEQEVNAAISQVNSDSIWQTLTHMTSYYNRSATKAYGVDTANWLKQTFDTMAQNYGRTDTDSYFVTTGWYKQPSLVTVIGKDKKGPGIVLGAHMDTLDGRMPGAGDDASGSSSVMEMARVLLASDYNLQRPIYIIWYAAEERGLVGSQYVVDHFTEHKIPVKAAIQFDMTGYRVNSTDPTMWVYMDFVSKNLSNFVAKLIDTYVQVPVDYSYCGYGCSDHASWTEAGIPAAFPCESNFEEHNPYIHTSKDTMDLLNLDHMTNFTKLGLAFALELGLE